MAPHSAGLSQAPLCRGATPSSDHRPEYPRPTSYYFQWAVSDNIRLTWADATKTTLHQNHSLKSVDGGSNFPGTQAQFCKHSALPSSHPHVCVTRTSLYLTAPCSLSSETPTSLFSLLPPSPTRRVSTVLSNCLHVTPVQSMVKPNILKPALKALHRMDPR